MRFDTSQQMRLGQQMRLAPRMIQSMEILQLSLLALQERIDQELESNVALEIAEPGADLQQVAEEKRDAEREERQGERELIVGEQTRDGSEDFERLSSMESSLGDALDGDSTWERPRARNDGERDRKMDAMANTPSRAESLVEQLQHQWALNEFTPEIGEAGKRIIEYIDDDGRLGADLETILDQSREIPGVEWSLELLEKALWAVQHTLEPAGMAARNVRESLLLQLEAIEEQDSDPEELAGWADVRTLIEDHFDDLLQNRLPRIEQRSHIPMARISAARERMRKLILAPGRELVSESPPPIIPDVMVEYDESNDCYVAALTDGLLPTLRVSPQYEQMAKDRSVEKPTREFVGNSVRNAQWLIESINQRKNTLLRVVNVVLARQRDFFDHGPLHLKPLPMIEVADQLGIHVGTVSRAVADKWLQTPRGVVPLRRFFSGGTETESGEDMSWEAVKEVVKGIIDAEDPAKPLSDQAISDALKEKGVTIARRTVVKYREQLGIPAARMRKRHS
ncbi:MAG: RNA polymerase factor sigma-54 [Phycisphaerales bacterium]|nr:RNA polymerase factor sigma-54 [Phycisphaerales bacterium]